MMIKVSICLSDDLAFVVVSFWRKWWCDRYISLWIFSMSWHCYKRYKHRPHLPPSLTPPPPPRQLFLIRLIYKIDKNLRRQCKMSSSKKIDLWRDIWAGVYLSVAQNPTIPILTHCIRVYSILIHKGKGGGELTREKVKGAIVHKAGSKVATRLTLSPVYKLY